MDVEQLHTYCMGKKGVTAEFPFDESTLVFKVMGKMYAATSLQEVEPRVNLKCQPDKAIQLRDRYPDIIPGYHMNKKHWNTVYLSRELTDKMIEELIDHSYDLVVAGLTKAQKDLLSQL